MGDLAFGLRLTAVGMGIIFALLALLWAVLAVVGRFDAALVAREEERGEGEGGEGAGPPGTRAVIEGGEDLPEDVVVAIAIAVTAHAAMVRREAAPSQRTFQPGSQMFASRWLAAGRTRQTRAYGRGRG